MGKRKLKYRSNVHLLKTGVYAPKVRKEYFSFGMQMPNRYTSTSAYRFGYNGMEKDPEIKGDGNSYTTEFRQYDPRLGRWSSLDPKMKMFPWISPYVAFANNPVVYTDPYGLEPGTGEEVGEEYEPDTGPDLMMNDGKKKGTSPTEISHGEHAKGEGPDVGSGHLTYEEMGKEVGRGEELSECYTQPNDVLIGRIRGMGDAFADDAESKKNGFRFY